MYQKRRYEERQREKKVSIKKYSIPRFGLGGLSHTKKKRRTIRRARVYDTGTSIVLSLYPTKLDYSLRGYSHRERCRAPDRKKSIERRRAEAGK
jgi:hypothetical protein